MKIYQYLNHFDHSFTRYIIYPTRYAVYKTNLNSQYKKNGVSINVVILSFAEGRKLSDEKSYIIYC